MSFDAFISYSSQDKIPANAACAVLEGAGIRCWIAPRDISAGAEYGTAIMEAIDHCRVMVLLFSSSANASRQIHREIERAVSKGIPILPVRIEEVTPTKSMEYFLGAIHWLDALSPPVEQHLQKLAETVNAMLKIGSVSNDRPADDEAQKVFTAKPVGAAERPSEHNKNAQSTGAVAFLHARPVRPNWILPAICGVVLLALLAGGGWLYRVGVFAPASAPSPTSSQPPQASPASLRAAAQARNFFVGAAAGTGQLRNDPIYSQILAQEYNMIEPETETRFFRVRPSRTEFNFADSDAIIDFANAHGIKLRGYPLATYYELPAWLTKGNFSASEISVILQEYIQTMLRRYRGRVSLWEVTTAVFDNLGKARETFWSKALGEDYIEQIITWAREADPQAKLFLNHDYSFNPLGPSSDAVYDLLRKFRVRGITIDGIAVGSASLLDRLPKPQDVATNLNRLAALGLEIQIEHFEMSMPLPATDQNLQRQAVAYNDYLSACLSISNCKAFITWGFSDKHAWAPNRWPGMGVGAAMPFDAAYKPKPAYQAMLDALRGREGCSVRSVEPKRAIVRESGGAAAVGHEPDSRRADVSMLRWSQAWYACGGGQNWVDYVRPTMTIARGDEG
jgi:endo-1,4-beta-xylanase